jgi:hypothetical protein
MWVSAFYMMSTLDSGGDRDKGLKKRQVARNRYVKTLKQNLL